MATATPSLRRVNQALPGSRPDNRSGTHGRGPAPSTPPSLVESLMRESADGIDVSARLAELKRAILTDGIVADDMGMSSHRIYIWLVLLRTPVLAYDTYAALLHRGASPAYAKINDDTHRTLATDPLFARRVSQNSIARLLNTIAWTLEDSNKQRLADHADSKALLTAAAAEEAARRMTDGLVFAGEQTAETHHLEDPSPVQLTAGMAALEVREKAHQEHLMPNETETRSAGDSAASTTLRSPNQLANASSDPQMIPANPYESSGATPKMMRATSERAEAATADTISTSMNTSLTGAPLHSSALPSPSTSSQPQLQPPSQIPPPSAPSLPAPYVQGMNVLAAPMLYAARSEAQAYAALVSLLTTQIPAYITPTMGGVHRGVQLVDQLLALLDPALHAHLSARGLTASVYAFPAVLTLSACTPPLPDVLILWDFLLCWGVHLNLLAVVAQLHLMRAKLMKSESPARDLRSLGPLRARKVVDLVVAFVGRVPATLWDEMVAHTGGGGAGESGSGGIGARGEGGNGEVGGDGGAG